MIARNHAVARTETDDLRGALIEMTGLAAQLIDYRPFHAAHTDLLARSGQIRESIIAYDHAIAIAPSAEDAAFLTKRRNRLML